MHRHKDAFVRASLGFALTSAIMDPYTIDAWHDKNTLIAEYGATADVPDDFVRDRTRYGQTQIAFLAIAASGTDMLA